MVSIDGRYHLRCARVTLKHLADLEFFACRKCEQAGRGQSKAKSATLTGMPPHSTVDDSRPHDGKAQSPAKSMTSGRSLRKRPAANELDPAPRPDPGLDLTSGPGAGSGTGAAGDGLGSTGPQRTRAASQTSPDAGVGATTDKHDRVSTMTKFVPTSLMLEDDTSDLSSVPDDDPNVQSPPTSDAGSSTNQVSLGSPRKKPRISNTSQSSEHRRSLGTAASSRQPQKDDSSADSPSSHPGKSLEKDPVRSSAISQFEIALVTIFGGPDPLNEDGEAREQAATRAGAFTQALEAKIFDVFGETPTGSGAKKGKAPGKQYRDRFRTLLFSLKDKSNDGLHGRIRSNELGPEVLATLPREQLANDALRAQVQEAKRDSIRQSILRPDKGPLRKITHKGEEYIEFDPGAIGNPRREEEQDKDDAGHQAYLAEMEREKEEKAKPRTPAISSADRFADTESNSQGTGTDTASKSVGKSTDLSSPRSPLHSSTELAGISSQSNKFDDDMDAFGPSDDHPVSDPGHDLQEDPGNTVASRVNADDIMDALDAPEEEYDPLAEFDKPTAPESGETSSTAPALSVSVDQEVSLAKPVPSVEPEDEDDVPYDPFASDIPVHSETKPVFPTDVVWRGMVTMPNMATFAAEAKQVGGRLASELGTDVWETFFPDSHSILQGRLPLHVAEGYLRQCVSAVGLEMLVWTLDELFDTHPFHQASIHGNTTPLTSPPPPPPPPTSSEENTRQFGVLLEYLAGKGRYAVWPAHPADKGLAVKDFYLAPLRAHSPWPEWLTSLGPQGLDEHSCQEDRMLLVAVLNKDTLQAGLDQRRKSSVSRTPRPEQAQATPSISSEPSSLRDLLGQLHGSYSSSLTSGAPPPLAPSSLGSNPMPIGSMSAEQTIQSLARMPQHEAESILYANPAIVNQLSSYLSVTPHSGPPPSLATRTPISVSSPSPHGTPVAPPVPPRRPPGLSFVPEPSLYADYNPDAYPGSAPSSYTSHPLPDPFPAGYSPPPASASARVHNPPGISAPASYTSSGFPHSPSYGDGGSPTPRDEPADGHGRSRWNRSRGPSRWGSGGAAVSRHEDRRWSRWGDRPSERHAYDGPPVGRRGFEGRDRDHDRDRDRGWGFERERSKWGSRP